MINTRTHATRELKQRIREKQPHLTVSINWWDSGNTTYPTGVKGWWARGEIFGVNKNTGNTERARVLFQSTQEGWTANLSPVRRVNNQVIRI